jgi:putative FmdB family regulatory protein
MPVYEYQCSACSRDFEYQQRMSDPDKTTCEVCGGSLERLISRTAFALKGGGWYKDLYASPKPAEAKADAAPAKADAAPASADKPAAKSPDTGSSGSTPSGSTGTTGSTSGSSGSASSPSAAAAKAP